MEKKVITQANQAQVTDKPNCVNKTFHEDSQSHACMQKTIPNEKQELSDISNNNNEVSKHIRTYYTYYTYSQLKDVQASERRHPFTTSYSPTIYREFRKAVHLSEPYYVKPNRVLEDFMINYILKVHEDQKQPQLTQFFIKADQMNIAKKQVVINKSEPKPVDYSKLSLEELQTLFDYAKKTNRLGQMQAAAFELKQRGITPWR